MKSSSILHDIIDTRDEQPPIWIAYPGSTTFQVLLSPLGAKQQEFLEEATETKWQVASLKKVREVNQQKYLSLFTGWVIVDWQGLKLDDLKKLVLLKDPVKYKKMKGEIEYDAATALLLMTHGPAFSSWVNRKSLDIALFNAEREEEAEKK